MSNIHQKMLVIPAYAGIQEPMAEELTRVTSVTVVVWIPAYAGMTEGITNVT